MQGLRHAKQFFGHFKLVALAYMETYQIGCYAIIQMENLRLFELPIDEKAETCNWDSDGSDRPENHHKSR